MEDVVTDIPPPSRFFPEDLDNFASPSPPLPPPFLLLSDQASTFRPSTLVVAVSPASRRLLCRLSSKTLIGALFLPELPLGAAALEPSLGDRGCSIYAAGGDTVLVSLQYPVAAERARSVAKRLVGDLSPGRVLVLDSIRSGGFSGRLFGGESLAFKLETSEQRVAGSSGALRSVPYYPTGSVADGVGAAVLTECQMRRLPGTLCVTWPEAGRLASTLPVESILRDFLPPGSEFQTGNAGQVAGADSYIYV